MLPDRKKAFVLIVLVLTVSLSACGPSAERSPKTTKDKLQTEKATTASDKVVSLAGTEWRLRSLRGEAPISNVVITLEIDKKEYGGFAGCNWYGGNYNSEDGSLKLRGNGMTSMGNPSDKACQQEETYANTLAEVVTYRVEGDRLELQNASGETILAYIRRPQWESDPAKLVDTQWKLRSLNGKSPEEGSTPTLSFGTEGRYSGYDGCRNFAGLYVANKDDLQFSTVSMKDWDCMKPVPPAGSGNPIGSIPAAGDYRLVDNRLEIRTVDGSTYVFVPPTGRNEGAQKTVPWKLEKFVENGEATPVLGETEITIAFDKGNLRNRGTVRGSAGCNEYTADYVNRSYPNGLEGPNFDDFTVTRKLCRSPEGIMEQERRYLGFLKAAKGYYQEIDGRLYLETGDGRKLVFSGSG